MAGIAEIVVERRLELDGDSYHEGDIIPYICWERHGQRYEMFNAKLWEIRNGAITILPYYHSNRNAEPLLNNPYVKDPELGYIYTVFVENIIYNEDVERYAYRAERKQNVFLRFIKDGEVYARTPQEAEKRLSESELAGYWEEEAGSWKDDIVVNIFCNGRLCLRSTGKLQTP